MATFLMVSRRFGTSKALLESLSKPLNIAEATAASSHKGTAAVWKRLFFFACCPCIAVAGINVATLEHPPRPEFKKYQHLRIRRKKYPWRDGVKTLFHNPHTNALPEGYEDVPEHH